MTSGFDQETNQMLDEYYGHDEDDLDDFIVYSDDDDDQALKKKNQHQQQEEEVDDLEEEEVEEEVEEEEEAPVGQQEILSLREKLKEKIRRKNAAMAAGAGNASCSSSVNQMMPPVKDKFGTFFGPSKPILARRVIEEGCSSIMKELQNAPSRKDAHLVSKAQPGAMENLPKPKFVSEEKRKVDTLRENRDYSSLFTDDADAPPPTKEQPDNRSALVQKCDTQVRGPIHSAGMSRMPTDQPARKLSKDQGLKVATSVQARIQSKAGYLGKDPLADRKRMIAAGRNGSSLPNNMKKTPVLQSSSNGQKLHSSLQSKRLQASIPGQRQQQPPSQGQRLQSNGRQPSLQGRRPGPYMQGQSSGQNGSVESHGRLKSAQKQVVASSKLKASRPMVKRAIKRKSDDETDHAFAELRGLTGYYPGKYAGRDEDVSNMEADYASIQKEERRSAKLARKEDEEQLRQIEEEEKRERAKKMKKVAQKQQ